MAGDEEARRDAAEALYRCGHTIEEVARELSVTYSVARRLLEGTTRRSPGRRPTGLVRPHRIVVTLSDTELEEIDPLSIDDRRAALLEWARR